MKTLNIEFLEELNHMLIGDVFHFFNKRLTWNYVDMLNWPVSYPYKPFCKFKIARSATKLYIRFDVKEKNLRAVNTTDQDPVWQDSCVEFFCKIPGQKHYFNFEFNCIGTCLATKREGRELHIVPFDSEQLMSIERHSSLPRSAFKEQSGNFEWQLTVGIPLQLIGAENTDILLANFYKCGDETSDPHYISWNNILSENPDFHLPEFFGKLKFV